MKDVLLVFARYPQPGKCKTRLIPKLGSDGAAEVHGRMTAYTLDWARELATAAPVVVEVQVAGGSPSAMAEQFGNDLNYSVQHGSSLGERLSAAFQRHFDGGAERIVVVGTDCPQLSSNVVREAFGRLRTHDACLAPAVDGGYALLGLRAGGAAVWPAGLSQTETANPPPLDVIFGNIAWGTAEVCKTTIERLQALGMRVSLLPTLSDVDLPQDLPLWEAVRAGVAQSPPSVSVIVPTYNREPWLQRALASANADPRAELLVVAAGDTQEALRVSADERAQFFEHAPQRAEQMNLGAEQASSETLLFLHADTILPPGYVDLVLQALQRPGVVGGGFPLRIDSRRWSAKLVQTGATMRSRLLRLPYGDQALFVRKARFLDLGGFARLPIMEDYDFVRQLRRQGRIALTSAPVTTSARRWNKLGFARTTLINQCMIMGFHLGIPVERLASFYRSNPKK